MLKREKNASAMGTTSPLLLDAFRAARRTAIEAAVFSLFVNLLMLTGPLYMLQIYDRVMSSHSYETLFVITALVVILFAGMAALDFARGALLARTAAAFEEKLKHLTFDMTLDASRVGLNVADQPLRDLRQIRQFVASPALVAVFDAPWAPIFLGVVFMMHWLLGLVALIGLILLAGLAFINERMSRHANTSAVSLSGEADRHAAASIRNAAAADAMGMRGTLRRRWAKLSDQANDHLLSATDTIGGLTAASKAIRLFLQSAILGTGAFVAIRGEATPGVMIAASIIAGRALAPIEIVTGQWKNFALSAAAFRRLTKFIEHFPVRSERTALPALERRRVGRAHFLPAAGAKHPILKNINFSLAAGEALGLIGPSAAGKSTLARAIAGVEPARRAPSAWTALIFPTGIWAR
ncbi:MAG: ABC transporter transmembrane domain-containing protein [Parvularculaceae bacterium]